jgi:hypothetical protein
MALPGDQMTDWVRIALYVGSVAAIVLIACLLIVGFSGGLSVSASLVQRISSHNSAKSRLTSGCILTMMSGGEVGC